MASDRPAFRPNRARASLSAIAPASTRKDKEKENGNNPSTLTLSTLDAAQPVRKKRAQSLGGDALEGLRKRTKLETLRAEATMTFELSPNKAERRRAAPRRSILKSVGVVFDNHTLNFGKPTTTTQRPSLDPTANTTDLSALSAFETSKPNRRRSSIRPVDTTVDRYDDSDEDEDDDDDPNGSLDMEITKMDITVAYDREGKRVHRASHSRRVSFAPAANVRHFTPDRPTAEAQTALAAKAAAEAAALELAERTGDTSFLSNTSGVSASDLEESDDDDDDEGGLESEPSMEIAGDEVTLAFKGHFAGTQLPVSALVPEREDNEGGERLTADGERDHAVSDAAGAAIGDDDDDNDDDGTRSMDEVTNDFTSQAFLNQQEQRGHDAGLVEDATRARPSTNRPRFSTIARQEDDDDEAIMRSLGFAKGGKPRKSRVGLAPVGQEEEGEEEEDDDDMEADDGSDMEDEDGTAAMEMATAVIPLQPQPEESDDEAESAEVSMQLVGNTTASRDDDDDDDDDGDNDGTMDMVEATASYGSILSAPLPRRSLGPSVFQPSSPFRARTTSPQKSPARPPAANLAAEPLAGPDRAQSVPVGAGGQPLDGTPSKSPFRRSGGYGTPTSSRRVSALPSPRRISVVPEGSTSAPARPRSRSRSRSASPNKQGPFRPPSSLAAKSPRIAAAATRATSPGAPRARTSPSRTKSPSLPPLGRPRPSLAAGRSPGGSLSLRGLMAAQQQQQHVTDDASTGGGQTAARAAEVELDLTASEFETSFDHTSDGPRPPASIEEFFDATGTQFVNDFIGRSGAFDLNSSRARRKSLAASAFDDDSKDRAPPTFADRVVAGACQLLMHDLYRNDQRLLIERMQETQGEYNELDAYIASGEIPGVFRDWAAASDEEKVNLKNQFAQIKLHYLVAGQVEWKATRNENMQQVVNAMEQRLDELRHDRAELEQFEFDAVIPSLEARHATLQAELVAESRLDEEISSYTDDQREELAQLHADIEEQEEQINGNRAKGIPGARPQFERVEQQLQKDRNVLETEREKEVEAKERIVELEAALKDKRTKSDLSRMKAEFDTLQQLHGWSLVEFTDALVHFRHFDELDVTFHLELDGSSLSKPASTSPLRVVSSEFRLVEAKTWSTTLALDVTNQLVGRIAERIGQEIESGNQDPRSLLHLIASQSLVLRRVRHEVAVASLSYPVHYDPTSESLELEVYAAGPSKAFVVSVPMREVELEVPPSGAADPSRWAEHLSAEVQVKFGGNIGSAGLAINERLNDCEGLLAALKAGEQALTR